MISIGLIPIKNNHIVKNYFSIKEFNHEYKTHDVKNNLISMNKFKINNMIIDFINSTETSIVIYDNFNSYMNSFMGNLSNKLKTTIINHSKEQSLTDVFEATLTKMLKDVYVKQWFKRTTKQLYKKYKSVVTYGTDVAYYNNLLFILFVLTLEKHYYSCLIDSFSSYTKNVLDDVSAYYVRCASSLRDMMFKAEIIQKDFKITSNNCTKVLDEIFDLDVYDVNDELSKLFSGYYSLISHLMSTKDTEFTAILSDEMKASFESGILTPLTSIMSPEASTSNEIKEFCDSVAFCLSKLETNISSYKEHMSNRIKSLIKTSNSIPEEVLKYFKEGKGIYSVDFLINEGSFIIGDFLS